MAKKILIIDDEPELVKAVEIRLKANGYEVVTAFDGLAGMDKAKETEPDLILLDVMMPGIDGFEVLRRLRDDSVLNYLPVIMLTAMGESGAILKAQDLGSTDYIIKPFNQEKLLGLIKRYI